MRVVRRHFVIQPPHPHSWSNLCVGASKQDVTHKLVMCELLILRACNFLQLNIWPVSGYTARHQSRETAYVGGKCEKICFDFGLTLMNTEQRQGIGKQREERQIFMRHRVCPESSFQQRYSVPSIKRNMVRGGKVRASWFRFESHDGARRVT